MRQSARRRGRLKAAAQVAWRLQIAALGDFRELALAVNRFSARL